ncbi:MAG: hypothetical protein ACO1TE_15075 [Prosthecobacter sp.]
MLFRSSTFLTLVILAAANAGQCCTIPVFRYALDRWEADKFHLVLPAAASKDTALQDLLRPLRANGKANLDITTSKDPAITQAELRPSRHDAQTPGAPAAPLWSGPLDKPALEALLDSPARQQILRSILAGDSMVWVLADSGSAADTAEAARIEKRLKFLEQVAALPIQDPNDPDSQLGPGPPLKLKFTLLRLRRDDPAEKLLLQMLAGTPKTKIDPAATSFAAVVFGKGRVLGAWPLADLDDRSLEETSMFLVGRCSCRLKTENPGWDLLLNIDWESALKAAGEASASTPASQPSGSDSPPSALSSTPPAHSMPQAPGSLPAGPDSPPPALRPSLSQPETVTITAPVESGPSSSRPSWATLSGLGAAALAVLLLGFRK